MTSPLLIETLSQIRSLQNPTLTEQLREAWNQRTKPPGSLGRLEDALVHYALIHNTASPQLRRKAMFLFCADHGIAAEGVSAFPQAVTAQMVRNFLAGGAAISVMCRRYGIESRIVDVGVIGPAEKGVLDYKIAQGTANFLKGPAMTNAQVNQALETGILLARQAARQFDVAGIGEMGIGNTTSASALLSALTGWDPSETAGAGTGIPQDRVWHKIEAIRRALAIHQSGIVSPIGMLECVGGFEIAAITGFLLGAAAARLPVMVDGFIASAAALLARALAPDCLDIAIFSHLSDELHHAKMLRLIGVEPQFALRMRLGEGSGAALAIDFLQTAVQLFQEMATFRDLQ